MVRALLKGDRSCQLSSTSHPLHKPWFKSLSPPVIFSYPSNTPSACRWRVCSPAVHLSPWYVTPKSTHSRHLHCRCPDHQQQKIRVVYSFLTVSLPCLIYTYPPSETCIKGHRSSSCKHTDRPLFEIKKKGRPVTQCEHCRELRKTKQVHVKCICESKAEPSSSKQGVFTFVLFVVTSRLAHG